MSGVTFDPNQPRGHRSNPGRWAAYEHSAPEAGLALLEFAFEAELTDDEALAYDHGAVLADDPRVQNGLVFDRVISDGTLYHRRRDNVVPHTPYSMRVQAHRELSDAELDQLAGLIGYGARAHIRGEPLGAPQRDSGFSFTVACDTTKSRRDDLGDAFFDFENALPALLTYGSPIRTTSRAGAGTKGTRLLDGFGQLRVELYYDDVFTTGM